MQRKRAAQAGRPARPHKHLRCKVQLVPLSTRQTRKDHLFLKGGERKVWCGVVSDMLGLLHAIIEGAMHLYDMSSESDQTSTGSKISLQKVPTGDYYSAHSLPLHVNSQVFLI